MEFVGRLAAFPVPHVLQWIHNDRRTGVLLVRSGEREKWISFRDGQIVACVSERPEELYSRYLLLQGYADPQTLVQALTVAEREGIRLGASLLGLGILTAEQTRETLRQHTLDSVCGLFLWTEGSFYFEGREVLQDELMPEALETISVILEGTRWIDEYRRICSAFVHESVLLGRGPRWPGKDLPPLAQRIVTGMEQRQTLSDLYLEIKGSYFRFLEAAFELVQGRVLVIGGWSARQAAIGGEAWVAAADEAAGMGEEPLLSQRHVTALLRLLPRLVPVWIDRASAAAKELQRQIPEVDGRAMLGELLATDPEVVNRRMDLIIDGLRRGLIALVPRQQAKV